MSTVSAYAPLPNPLLTAIGRVAISSVRLEDALRDVVGQLSGDDDAGWIIFEGQSIDWLITNGIAILDQCVEDATGSNRRLGSYGSRLRSLFKEADTLKKDRNVIIHGEWRIDCFFGLNNEPFKCRRRSPDTVPDDELFHVIRSRYRKGYAEEAWSTAEIENLAEKIETTAYELSVTYKKSKDEWLQRARTRTSSGNTP